MNKELGRELMKQLVADFKKYELQCLKKTFKEAVARKLYIDKFFEALGWATSGQMGVSPEQQEVVVEESLDSEDSINKKFVDYTFKILKTTKFMCEAKKPSENINNKSYIFQAKSYAFSQGVPFIILTNFYEMKLFDISTKPLENQPDTDNVEEFSLKYTQYVEKFDLLWDVFSRESIENGSLVKLYVGRRGIEEEEINSFGVHKYINIKGSSMLDNAFLRDMQEWRSMLSQDIHKNNIDMDTEEISEIVQLTLDRIIFVRILEDRGIEPIEILKSIILKYKDEKIDSIKNALDEKYRELDRTYSGLLFNNNDLCNECKISNEILYYIIENLYYNKSPYNFKYIKIEILGSMFEQYLGSKLVKYDDEVSIELKPEYRKLGGVYYTPEYITNEIVDSTVIPVMKKLTFDQYSDFKLLDLTVGSGSMLVKAYKCLMNLYLDNILNNDVVKDKCLSDGSIEFKDGEYKLTLKLKREILVNNIFGVDVDSRAVEITKMSLYITLLEDEKDVLNQSSILPNLDKNIMCGDSLVDNEYKLKYDKSSKINAFNWESQFKDIMKRGKFNCIIGNPPYIKYQLIEELYPQSIKTYWAKKFKDVIYGNYDVYILFIKKAMDLLHDKGRIGYILPNKFFITTYGSGLRKLISEKKSLAKIVYFGDKQIFDGVTTYTTLMFLDNDNDNNFFEYINVSNINKWLNGEEKVILISKDDISHKKWLFTNPEIKEVFEKLKQEGTELSNVVDRVFVGIQTNGDKIYMVKEMEEQEDEEFIYCYSNYTKKIHKFERNHLKDVVKGSLDLKKYYINDKRKMKLIFPYNIIEDKAVLIDKDEYANNYPCTWNYLNEVKDVLISRTKSINRKKVEMNEKNWYGYVYLKNLSRYGTNKILVPSMSIGAAFSYEDTGNIYFIGSGTGGGGGYAITLDSKKSPFSYYSLLGILNSSVSNFVIILTTDVFNNGYNGIKKEIINDLIIPKINVEDKKQMDILSEIEKTTELIIECKKNIDKQKSQRKLRSLEQEYEDLLYNNDSLVYKLFNLTVSEIDIIENNIC